MRILGIDPGSRFCGWGVIEETRDANTLRHVDCGLIAPLAKMSLPERLGVLYEGMREKIATYSPDEVGVESLFFAMNARSALVLGHARGVAILAAVRAGLPVFEYSPSQIKQAVCGYGRAEKAQVARMVMAILNLPEVAQSDAADALACAICHCNSYRMQRKMKEL